MAISKFMIASLLISFLVLQLVQAEQTANASPVVGAPVKIDCNGACKARCLKSKRPRLCQRSCGTCCGRCNCVPPGTYGNYEACACYAALTTRGGARKCP